MSFEPRHALTIDHDGTSDKLMVRCPFWANDLLNDLPSKRWGKSARAWMVPIIKQNMVEIARLSSLAGVTVTPAARAAIKDYENKIMGMGKRGEGFPPWYKFKTEPRKHQRAALEKGYGLRPFALFMDMQTGKSKTAIDLCACHRMEGHIDSVLIIVKRTLRRNWIKQLEQHCPIPFSVHLPETSEQRKFEKWLFSKHDFKIMIVGWESLSAGGMADMCERFLNTMPKVAIIGDETSYITNHKATRTEKTISFGRKAEYRYALTGTPAAEGPMNLFSQFEFLDPNIIGIGDFYAFRNRYAIMGGYQREIRPGVKQPTEIVGYQNIDELMNLVAPYSFQVTKKEAYDLPPKRYEVRTVPLTKKQRELYDTIKRDRVIVRTGKEEDIINNVLTLSLRLHQVAGGYTVKQRWDKRVGRDGVPKLITKYDPVEVIKPQDNPKMLELCDIVEEFKGKKQGLIWVVYAPEIEAIVGLMKKMGMRVGEMHGGVPDPERQPIVDAFQRGELDLIVGNASTGGMGYTMMASEVNIFYNNTFKAIDRIQAEDRAYGDGQLKSGVWIDIVAEKTIDVTVAKALELKQDLSEYVRHRLGEITRLLDGE